MLSQFMVEEASTEYLDLLPKVRVLEWQNLDLNSGSPAPKVYTAGGNNWYLQPHDTSYRGDRVVYKANGSWQKEPL